MKLAEFQKEFKPKFEEKLQDNIDTLSQLTRDNFLISILNHSLKLAGSGKRIRPYMVRLAYDIFGGDDKKNIWDVLIGIEMFHMFALIHDDVMDEAATRRGVMTTHVYVANEMMSEERSGTVRKVGESQAILLGDLFHSWTMVQFENTPAAVRQQFQKMSNEVIFGQMIDVDLSTRDRPSRELIEQKMRLKTASYTFVRPMLIGLNLAGGSEEQIEFCEKFGMALGMAFQIQDDLHDLMSTEKQIKKPVFSDLRERQQTLFTQHIFDDNNPEYLERLIRLHGNPELNESYRQEILDLFTSSGAVEAGKKEMEKQFKIAKFLVQTGPVSAENKDSLIDLVDFVSNRSS